MAFFGLNGAIAAKKVESVGKQAHTRSKKAFVIGGIDFSCFFVLSVLEKREHIAYKTIKGGGIREIFSLFHIENFVFCLGVACPVEITGMTLSFWIPTLLNE